MEIKLKKSELVDIINEDIDRLASRSFSEDGTPLYDAIRIKSRDAGVQGRMLEERDARLRGFLAFCLGVKEDETVDVKDKDGKVVEQYINIVYDVVVTNLPKPPSASSLKVLLRKYLVDSVLYDWYTKHGIPASITYEDIEALESKLVCTMRQGYTRKPMQPFGPKF